MNAQLKQDKILDKLVTDGLLLSYEYKNCDDIVSTHETIILSFPNGIKIEIESWGDAFASKLFIWDRSG